MQKNNKAPIKLQSKHEVLKLPYLYYHLQPN